MAHSVVPPVLHHLLSEVEFFFVEVREEQEKAEGYPGKKKVNGFYLLRGQMKKLMSSAQCPTIKTTVIRETIEFELQSMHTKS